MRSDGVDDRVRAALQRPSIGRWRRLDRSVERRARAHCAHLHEARAFAAAGIEPPSAIDEKFVTCVSLAPRARSESSHASDRRRERAARAHRQIGAEQRARLHVNRADDIAEYESMATSAATPIAIDDMESTRRRRVVRVSRHASAEQTLARSAMHHAARTLSSTTRRRSDRSCAARAQRARGRA